MDYAAATPVDVAVFAAMKPYFAGAFYNPSALYQSARIVRRDVEAARARVAYNLGVRPGEIVFTAGGTEANNLAIHGVMQRFPGSRMVVSSIEHESVLRPSHQYDVKEAPVDTFGTVKVQAVQELIDNHTVLVSMMMANNEIGTIQPLARFSHMIKRIRHERLLAGNSLPLYLHTDACQAANYLNLRNLGVDLMTLNGGKIYGPKQTGVLYVKAGVSFSSQILGGGQEAGRRSGTENVAGCIGFATALDRAQEGRLEETKRLQALQAYGSELLVKKIPGVILNGTAHGLLNRSATPKQVGHAIRAGHRLPNNIHLTIPGVDNERLIFALDEAGIQAAAGSACSASNEEPSHVLRAIGLSDEQAQSSLRFSMGRQTTQMEIEYTVLELAKIVAR